MTQGIVLAPRAEADLDAIWAWIAPHHRAAAMRAIERILAGIALLRDFPLAGAARDDILPGIRAHPVRPWLILYRLDPDAVLVVRVLDSRSNPADWAA